MFKASVKSILYTVLKSGENEIFGIPNMFEDRKLMEFSAIENEALAEMVHNGCADMDFDGKITISADFIEIVRACARCREVAVIDIRTDAAKQKHTSLYFVNNGIISVENLDDIYGGMCSVGYVKKQQIIGWIEENIGKFGNADNKLKEIILESGVVSRCSIDEMMKSGCSQVQARYIKNVIEGKGKIIISRKIKNDIETQACSFICYENAEMEVNIIYRENEEKIVFSPVNKDHIISKLSTVLE